MSTQTHPQADTSTVRVALGLVAAAVVAIAVNTGVALAALALDPNGTRTGLDVVAYAPLTVVGVLIGTIGWAAIRRYAAHARSVLRVVVPVVVVLTFIPDTVLLLTGAADGINTVGLMVMHVVVAAATVAAVSRVLPLVGYRRTAEFTQFTPRRRSRSSSSRSNSWLMALCAALRRAVGIRSAARTAAASWVSRASLASA